MSRCCAQCGRNLPRTSYTSNQFSKGEGLSRCASCVHGHNFDTAAAAPSDSGRYNNSSNATFTTSALSHPFASGAFRFVAKGRYTTGARAGQAAVTKWFKTGTVFESDYFTLDIKAVDKALEIVNRFNQLNIGSKTIQVNVPGVWTFTSDSSPRWAGTKSLTEPFIQNYQKFNSNTGWTDTTRQCAQLMQALSHFSYHISGGNYVLCDIQGGIYQHEVVLSDPVILSRNREYGVTDLGPEAISSFFSTHDCNAYCRPNWTLPANPVRYFQPKMGTTMLRHTVRTARSKPAGTLAMPTYAEEDEDEDMEW
ncbi:kinase-like domain-containing protein [Cercophora newfieldiana]|uniref:Kinase-like domain-containing protein n=1 Tax=Cercophora newfieldiana TaxID=92897 RepID=A0AA39Y7P3_9PEZI|nr:kinase-like domain-containing protein [Cercophora newfieldiana]